MAQMTIIRNSRGEGKTTTTGQSKGTFTGTVYLDRLHTDANISINNVNFTPCSRTFWHRHKGGQLLRVVAGSGWVCDLGAMPQRINVGDVVWCPPGTVHWHGADDGSYMVHLAVSHGTTEWLEPVTEAEFDQVRGKA